MPNFGSGRATLTTTQKTLTTAAQSVLSANAGRLYGEVKNMDASINMFIGPDNAVTTANGHLVKPGESFGIENYRGDIWAIAASATPVMSTIEW